MGRMRLTAAVGAALAVLAAGPGMPSAEASGLKSLARTVLDTAHRGLVGPMVRKGENYADPNTIAACVNAVRHHVDACEFDIRFTADGQPVVSHSHALDGWTNCTGEIEKKKLAQVTGCRTKHGEHVPSLDDFLAEVTAKSSTIRFLEDLKPKTITDAQLARLVQLDKNHGVDGTRLRFSTPVEDVLRRLERLRPTANKALLVNRGTTLPTSSDLKLDVVDTVLVHVKSLRDRLAKDPSYIRSLHSHGVGVSVWGAKSLSRMKQLVRLRVEEIVTKRADVFEDWRSG